MIKYALHVFSSLFLLGLVLIGGPSYSQKSQKYYGSAEEYRKAMDLFEKEKYASAQTHFDEIIRTQNNPHDDLSSNAAYYKALCGLMLFNDNAENLLIEFITEYPESPKVNRAYFDLGKYQYRKRRYGKALQWFEKVNVYNLDNEELAEFYFKEGYAYFKEGKNKEAQQSLFEIKDAETKYSVVAKYYFAHLSYESGNLEVALKYFREIEHEANFAPIIPYYISQILYGQEKYEELISYASNLLDSGKAQRSHEIAKFIGESYYRLGQYEKSIPYLKKFVDNGSEVKPEDYYQIAMANMELEAYEEAVSWYQQALSDSDSMNQIIQYNMAEAYLKLDKKRLARNAMRTAYMIGDDPELKENALYDYAKLSYELSQFPFNDAVRAFEEYINTYPKSPLLEEAHEYLVGVYFTTKNYEEARKSLDRIQNRGLKLNLAYQKILYYLGVENMNKGQYEGSIAYFDLAIQQNYDRRYTIDAMFWKAEALFRLVQYDQSILVYNDFLLQAGAISSEYYQLAQYNLAYAYFRKRDFKSAIFRFRQFTSTASNEQVNLKNDALLRTADSYFITKEYKNASEYYDKAVAIGAFDADYALFQSALASGVLGNYDAKIAKLKQLKTDHQNSLYFDDALYELGDILFIKGKNEEAQAQFEKLIIEIPESPYYGKSMLKSGLIYYNQNKDTLALDRFKVVVRDYRNTSDSKQALEKIKQIYIDRGDLQGFEVYMSGIGIENLPTFSLDSASYEIAENAYLENNCEDAVKNFTLYLDKYPEGLFSINAHYYKGECELRSSFKEEALIDFEYVINKPKSLFTEKSLLHAAGISREMDQKEKALKYYALLEKKADQKDNLDKAQYWLMRMNFETGNDGEGLTYGDLLLKKENLSDEIKEEIYIKSGHVYLKTDQYNKAFDTYQLLKEANTKGGAEAKYNLAYIEFMRGNLDQSEEFIDVLLNQVPAYDYWIAKCFILWSDIYASRGDDYQAKVSLETVIENYEGEDLKNVASEKLRSIEKLEQIEKDSKSRKKEELQIDLSGQEDYDYLFDEEEIDE